MIVGASRGLGRGIASAFADAGADVVAVARTDLPEITAGRPTIGAELVDATDEATVRRLIEQHNPQLLILVAGAVPAMGELRQQTWDTFSLNWNADVKIAFTWLREALTKPLSPGSKVVVISSGAALNGSPLSGGYAGAKATQRFIAQYAQAESDRAGLGITFTTVMPRMTPFGDVGRAGIRAYAELSAQSEDEYLRQLGPLTTPEIAGTALVKLLRAEPPTADSAYLLTGAGLQPLP
jgi:NAD(P)-dependent dehydrogenase (short-subunit alcohol dehydrogenase family)